ncbi:hypothetical protein Q5P01_024261 [Channa striata]|uniref:Fibronectin type-III domain-containing protein n=1 Tax=Channa striata TaxID=64152 RepID=A0AA88J7J0_CHASR|nr:hypothetical protein Q5P01_024261 [Channa striata]
MLDCGFQFLHSRCSSCASHLPFLILGLILLNYTTVSSCVKQSRVNCNSIPFTYQHCSFHSAGVRDLDCFLDKIKKETKCVWKPGDHSSKKTHTLIIRQHHKGKEICQKNENLTRAFEMITHYSNINITAEVYENSESTNCTKTIFRGSTFCLDRCGPPVNVSFSRHSGKLDVDVTWKMENLNSMQFYFVRYKALGKELWNESPVQSQDKKRCTVENLNPSLIYFVQIQCVVNKTCSKYPWSQTFPVPSELTTKPEIDRFEITDIAKRNGKRLIFLSWKFSSKEPYDSYSVSVGKASGEFSDQQIITHQPEIRLILSYSDFDLSIRAVNNASSSPAVSRFIPLRQDLSTFGDGRLNVTVHNNRSFTVHWKQDLIKSFVCFSVEWRKKGHKAAHMSFFEQDYNYRTLSPLREPLEPYKRYTITLHKRSEKETCNMKSINNSESTYGSTQFYFMEGTPVRAPENVSSHNTTVNSVVLKWSPIPEEDARGFLLGYTIHYMEYPMGAERNITVGVTSTSYKVEDLKNGTAYEFQISGFTKAGAGKRSEPSRFTTKNNEGHFHINLSSIIPVFAVLIAFLIFGPSIMKRTKVLVWPSIPNPGNSYTMQKIERTCELELLESITTLKVEEWDTNSLQIVEKEDGIGETFPCLRDSRDEGDAPEITRDWIQRDAEDSTEDVLYDEPTETISTLPRTNLQSSPLAFSSGYTTMEMFNQVKPQGNPANTDAEESEPESADLTVVKSGLDYLGQFSTSPVSESEMLTIF